MTTQDSTRVTVRAIAAFGVITLVFSFLPLLAVGRWDWWPGWAYGIVMTLAALFSRLLLAQRHPDLLAERGKGLNVAGTKPWDRKLAPIVGVVGPFTTLVVCVLDVRFGWSPALPLWLTVLALIVMIAMNVFGSWALLENRFFSGTVRIQAERGHHVIDSGPYRWVRHPGYVSSIWIFLLTPVFLGSLWGLIPAVLTDAALVLRTALEDRALQAELPGYKEFARKTRYRLLPGIW